MKLKQLVRVMTPDELRRFAKLSKTTEKHVRFQIANGHITAGLKMAARMCKASRVMFPDQRERWLAIEDLRPELRAIVEELRA